MSRHPEKTFAPNTPEQIESMRKAGRILAGLFRDLRVYVKPGVTEIEVDKWVYDETIKRGATPTYLEPVPNFPGSICISTNDELVHSIPKDRPFEVGDVVSFDMVITYEGMKVDSAFTMVVGEEPSGAVKHLLNITEQSLYAGIDAIKGAGTTTGDIGAAIEKVLSHGKLGIVTELIGHGVGQEMHMPPDVPNYGKKGSGAVLRVGDTIAIEPMATLGSGRIKQLADDEWTIYSKDNSLCAHFEHTVLITENGVEILTQL